jgi:hypothetical protein
METLLSTFKFIFLGTVLIWLVCAGTACAGPSNQGASSPISGFSKNLEMPKLPNGSDYSDLPKSGGISKTIGAGTSVNL